MASNTSPNKTTISTPRLLLRAAQPSDSKSLYPIFADGEVMRYWSEPPHATPARTQEWVESMVESSQNGITDFIITLKRPSEVIIGKIGIYGPLPSNEIGFLISREYWGQGLAVEALGYMLQYLLCLLPLDISVAEDKEQKFTSLSRAELTEGKWRYASITADVDPRNVACLGILMKFGFEKIGFMERTWCVGGVWTDSVYLRLSKEEWMRRKGENQEEEK